MFSGVYVCLFICFSIRYLTDTAIGTPNMSTLSAISLKIHLFWAQEVKGQGHGAQKHYRRVSWRSCECWLLLCSSCSREHMKATQRANLTSQTRAPLASNHREHSPFVSACNVIESEFVETVFESERARL